MGCVSSSASREAVNELEARVIELEDALEHQKELAEQRRREVENLTETAETSSARIADLEADLLEARTAVDRAVNLKKEWQLQAASAAAKLEKYRDRYETMIQGNKIELESRVRQELDLEMRKKEFQLESELKTEKEKRSAYERILMNVGYTSGLLSTTSQAANIPTSSTFVSRIPPLDGPPPVATQVAAEAAEPPPTASVAPAAAAGAKEPGAMWRSILGRTKRDIATN